MNTRPLVKEFDSHQEISQIVNFFREYEEGLSNSTELAKYVTGSSAAYINIIDAKNQYIVASSGNVPLDVIPIDISICKHTLEVGSPLIIENTRKQHLTKDLPYVLDGTVGFYAGVPIDNPYGDNFGTICVVDQQSRNISDEEINALQNISGQIRVWIDLFHKHKQERKLQESQDRLETLFAEIHHRIKNNLADIIGLLQIQESETSLDEVREILQKTGRRISTVAQIHEILYESNTYTETNLKKYISKLINSISDALINDQDITFNLHIDNIHLDVSQTLPFGLIVNEMVTNAIEHAFEDKEEGIINIDITEEEGYITLQLSDNGKGLGDGDFSLFDFGNLGMTLIHLLSRQLHANIQIHSNTGTAYYLRFPKKE